MNIRDKRKCANFDWRRGGSMRNRSTRFRRWWRWGLVGGGPRSSRIQEDQVLIIVSRRSSEAVDYTYGWSMCAMMEAYPCCHSHGEYWIDWSHSFPPALGSRWEAPCWFLWRTAATWHAPPYRMNERLARTIGFVVKKRNSCDIRCCSSNHPHQCPGDRRSGAPILVHWRLRWVQPE